MELWYPFWSILYGVNEAVDSFVQLVCNFPRTQQFRHQIASFIFSILGLNILVILHSVTCSFNVSSKSIMDILHLFSEIGISTWPNRMLAVLCALNSCIEDLYAMRNKGFIYSQSLWWSETYLARCGLIGCSIRLWVQRSRSGRLGSSEIADVWNSVDSTFLRLSEWNYKLDIPNP